MNIIMSIIGFATGGARNRMIIYAAIAGVLLVFGTGFYYGFSMANGFNNSANLKAIKKDVEVKKGLDEIRNKPIDSNAFRGKLWDGKY